MMYMCLLLLGAPAWRQWLGERVRAHAFVVIMFCCNAAARLCAGYVLSMRSSTGCQCAQQERG
jgi:hypothetical protein